MPQDSPDLGGFPQQISTKSLQVVSEDPLAKIALKIRRNLPLATIEVAAWAGVTPKTITSVWIKRQGLPASKLGYRTIRIEPNALVIWLREFRAKKFRGKKVGPAGDGSGFSNIIENRKLSTDKGGQNA